MMNEEWIKKTGKKLAKFKYAALVVALGVLLMALPSLFGESAGQTERTGERTETELTLADLEQRLSETLSQCAGVGKTTVLLTQKTSAESVYEKDYAKTSRDQADSGGSEREEEEESALSLVKTGSYGEQPVLIRQNYPEPMGALIVCEGGDSAQVRLMVTEAVRALTGLGSESITVMKMD